MLELGMEPAGSARSGGPLLTTASRMDCLQPLNCEGASGAEPATQQSHRGYDLENRAGTGRSAFGLLARGNH